MKEYICKEVPPENGWYLDVDRELIHCVDCRFYNKIIAVCRSVGEHEGICRHPQGCIATDPWGYCHYAQRKEDVPGEGPES